MVVFSQMVLANQGFLLSGKVGKRYHTKWRLLVPIFKRGTDLWVVESAAQDDAVQDDAAQLITDDRFLPNLQMP